MRLQDTKQKVLVFGFLNKIAHFKSHPEGQDTSQTKGIASPGEVGRLYSEKEVLCVNELRVG